jgi:hypothetical protein
LADLRDYLITIGRERDPLQALLDRSGGIRQ